MVTVTDWRLITRFNAILEDSNLPLGIDLWPSTDLSKVFWGYHYLGGTYGFYFIHLYLEA